MAGPGQTSTSAITILSPGFRTGWNIGDAQVIVGAALPFTFSGGTTDTGIFTYFGTKRRSGRSGSPKAGDDDGGDLPGRSTRYSAPCSSSAGICAKPKP